MGSVMVDHCMLSTKFLPSMEHIASILIMMLLLDVILNWVVLTGMVHILEEIMICRTNFTSNFLDVLDTLERIEMHTRLDNEN